MLNILVFYICVSVTPLTSRYCKGSVCVTMFLNLQVIKISLDPAKNGTKSEPVATESFKPEQQPEKPKATSEPPVQVNGSGSHSRESKASVTLRSNVRGLLSYIAFLWLNASIWIVFMNFHGKKYQFSGLWLKQIHQYCDWSCFNWPLYE